MGEEEDVQELEEAEREFIAYLEKAKEKEIQVCQTNNLPHNFNSNILTGNSEWKRFAVFSLHPRSRSVERGIATICQDYVRPTCLLAAPGFYVIPGSRANIGAEGSHQGTSIALFVSSCNSTFLQTLSSSVRKCWSDHPVHWNCHKDKSTPVAQVEEAVSVQQVPGVEPPHGRI